MGEPPSPDLRASKGTAHHQPHHRDRFKESRAHLGEIARDHLRLIGDGGEPHADGQAGGEWKPAAPYPVLKLRFARS